MIKKLRQSSEPQNHREEAAREVKPIRQLSTTEIATMPAGKARTTAK